MSGAQTRVRPPLRWIVLALVLTVVAGLAAGFLLAPAHERTLDYFRATVLPASVGATWVIALLRKTAPPRWLIPLIFFTLASEIYMNPHVASLSAVGIVVGVIAVVASAYDRKGPAIAGALVCCAGIGASLVLALARS